MLHFGSSKHSSNLWEFAYLQKNKTNRQLRGHPFQRWLLLQLHIYNVFLALHLATRSRGGQRKKKELTAPKRERRNHNFAKRSPASQLLEQVGTCFICLSAQKKDRRVQGARVSCEVQ